MKTSLRVALIAGVLAAAWLAMRPGQPPVPQAPPGVGQSLAKNQVPTPSSTAGRRPDSFATQPTTPDGQHRDGRALMAEWLSRPPTRGFSNLPQPGEVPEFDAATLADLLRRFREPDSPTNKLTVAYLLALRGGPEVVVAFTGALTNTYAGHALTREESYSLEAWTSLLGVAGRRHPEALQFLERARDIDFWRGIRLWHVRDRTDDYLRRGLVGAAISGTAWSGRPEVEQMLRYYRENPAALDETQTHGVVAEAAHIRALVNEVGFERAWELIRKSGVDTWFQESRRWRSTPEAREWWNWYLEVQARLAGQAKP